MFLSINCFVVEIEAKENIGREINDKSTIKGYITDENNKKIYLDCKKIAKRVKKGSVLEVEPTENIEEVYQVEVPESVFSLEKTSLSTENRSDKVTQKDGTASAQGTLTIKYTRTTGTPPLLYKLTNVSGSWKDLNTGDKIKISSSGKLSYICFGIGENNLWRKQNKSDITVNSGFSKSTGFKYAITDEYGSMGATLTVPMNQGTSRKWNLTVQNYRFGG